ncbi:hypothetical protein COY87_00150 [Candidatus Roizmanbacteria bacterium CG_4_10_14_0_8_um_filter_33_9]|uniref:Glycosyl transferase family 1 domain-containing protein n=1 Tax=Candidatus Roizmanbacteria bacterium CG_4_10_14_0_8_um_filter_33_9 TaxID=1974826 RepID=A0A2M7QKW5_9BACT|nr:MAG: hypothetical protein COY87_00150 [Candidatus Roizmanbacteria bacterium CG_4_10_14_0_8_um_filter_33_9]
MNNVLVYDPTAKDSQSKVRGIGRYMQILRETFPKWYFSPNLQLPISNLPFEKPQGKQSPTTFINPFFNFLSPPLFIRRKFPKQIAVIHDLIPLKYPEHFPIGLKGNISVLLNKIALLSYDVVITDSVQSKQDLVAILHIPEKKVKVIYPCLPAIFNQNCHPEFISGSENKIPKQTFIEKILNQVQNDSQKVRDYLLYVGDATWNKNLVNLAKAIKLQELPCVFVGKVFSKVNKLENKASAVDDFFRLGRPEGREPTGEKKLSTSVLNNPWNEDLNEFMSLAKDDKRFIFPGFITDEELIQLYQNSLCNVLVSRDEGFGFSYLEASNQQCPSILSDIPVFREISNNKALFVDPKSPRSIVSAIQSFQNNNVLRNSLIKQSYERSTIFSQQSLKDQFLSIISSLNTEF